MSSSSYDSLPTFETILLSRKGRLLTITFNRPEAMNAVTAKMHAELPEVFVFASTDPHSDVVVLTGAGPAFSAGGDMAHIQSHADNPSQFDEEVRQAKRIVFAILDMEKPLICRMNGHAVGLGATLALFCDIVFAADNARIGDPHVSIGLVAGDGGAVIWPQRIGFTLAKEFLMTGELLSATRARDIGLINHCMPPEELDAAVQQCCDRLLAGAQDAIRWTKTLVNLELKRIATATMDVGLAYEGVTVRSADYREGIAALREKRKPVFEGAARDLLDAFPEET